MTPLRSWEIFVFGAAALSLLLVGALAYRVVDASAKDDALVSQSHEVLENLERAHRAAVSIESNSRAYVITGEVAYDEARRAVIESMRGDLAALQALTVDNVAQQRRIPAIERLLAERVRLSSTAIALYRSAGFAAAVDATRAARNFALTRELDAALQSMREEERSLLARLAADSRRRVAQTRLLAILAALLATLIAGAACWRVYRDATRRRVAERALRHSEDQYQSLVQGVEDHAIIMLDPAGLIVSWNTGAERMTGSRAEDVVGKSVSMFSLPEDIRSGATDDILRLAAVNGHHHAQGIRIRANGTVFHVSSTFTAVFDAKSALRGFSVISRDLTQSAEADAKYRGLLEAAPDAMVVVDQSGRIVLLNVQAEKQFGYRRDELVGQPVTNIIPVGFAERLIADGGRSAAEALSQQIGAGIELTALRKDGSEFPIEMMLSPLESPEGVLVTAAIRNISVHRAAENVLAHMEGRYRGLLEAAPDAMVVVDQAGEIVLLNLQAEKQFGYRRNELLGQKVTNIIPEGFAERLVADGLRSAEEALAQQIGMGIELTALRNDGSEFPIELMLSPLSGADGILVTAAIRDITARKSAEARLLQNVAELNRSNEELGQFAYIASHDLQEPLRMVASYTRLLSRRYKGQLDAQANEFIDFAEDGANRMQRLIQDLLAYSRIGSRGEERRELESEVALCHALMNLRGAIEESGAVVTYGPLPIISGDETQLIQLFQNLIGNAIKYQGPGVPLIHVSAVSEGGKWVFSVDDNGLGIDDQYFEKIFGMFQRLHRRDEFEGTGIGLAICKKIVERHGGLISVESRPGQGSTFRFDLAAA